MNSPDNFLFIHGLGKSERAVLQLLWADSPQTAREILTTIRRSRDVAYTTISTTLDHLYQRGLLSREPEYPKHSRRSAWRYTPRMTRQELLIHAIDQICAELQIDEVERQYAAMTLRGRRRAA